MKLYEYDDRMEAAFDPETGEIDEELVNALWAERDERIDQFIRWIKTQEADAAALKEEERKFSERRKTLENAASRGRAYVQRILDGSRFFCTAGSVSYRKVSSVVVANTPALIRWAEQTGQEQVLKYKDPEVSKTELKKLIEADGPVKVPKELAEIITRMSMQIK